MSNMITFYKIPWVSGNEFLEMPGSNEKTTLEEARLFFNGVDVDKSKRWIVVKNGKNIGDAIERTLWRYDTCLNKVRPYIVKSMNKSNFYFETKEEAIEHYNISKEKAEKLLKEFKKRLSEFIENSPFSIGYVMQGDTHGIYEDYMYLSITLDGYLHKIRFDDMYEE